MLWKLLSYSEILQPLPPYMCNYMVGIVEDEKGTRKIVHVDKTIKEKIYIGAKGLIKEVDSPSGFLEKFVPIKQANNIIQKVALITGSSRGIGRAIALEFAKQGFSIVVNSSHRGEEGYKVIEEIENFNGKAIYFQADVSDSKQVKTMVNDTIKKFERIDVLINNAGITFDKRLVDLSLRDWNKVLSINLSGTFNCTSEVLKVMIKQGLGKIINISSVIGETGNVGQANYAASKGGIIAFTKSVAKEYASFGINVNAIAPGFIKTKMLETIPKYFLNEIISSIPLGRLGKPEEVAKLAYFLASNEANYITGQVFNINGGLFM